VEFHTSPSTTIEALISINNQLQLPDAAIGVLKYTQVHHHDLELKEHWYYFTHPLNILTLLTKLTILILLILSVPP
jgi:phosphatidylinositol kinase/protein kinase (PI-3  family)